MSAYEQILIKAINRFIQFFIWSKSIGNIKLHNC